MGEVQMGLYRMSFAAGFAAGFVVGTRAGREKYDQMVKFARATAEHPAVQQAAGVVQAQATGLAQKVGGQLHDRVPQMAQSAAHSVGGHISGMKHRNGHHKDRAGRDNAASNGGKGSGNTHPFAGTSNSKPGPNSS
jgi:hypothetical protein